MPNQRLPLNVFPYDPSAEPVHGPGLGWRPDVPDLRDRTVVDGARGEQLFAELVEAQLSGSPPRVHLGLDNEVQHQLSLGSCTAQAVVTLVEYLLRKRLGSHHDFSRLFLYKVTRRLLGWKGDQGAYLRDTIKAMAVFGVPPERYWPYVIDRFDDEPEAFLYSFGQSFKALDYVRLDPAGLGGREVLERVRKSLVAGYPVVFGFPVYSSISSAADIPAPSPTDRVLGGHAVVAVGYDDAHETPSGARVPALIIQNSWGPDWGDQGFGYLPYSYVEQGLALDFWTILKQDWVPLPVFG